MEVEYKNLKISYKKNGTFSKRPIEKVLGYQGFGEKLLFIRK